MNLGKKPFRIQPNDRIGQLVFTRYAVAEFELVDKLDETERGETGFGESGVK